jgi:hypothetical protein
LGIGPDGSLDAIQISPKERGLLSRKQADAVALISLLLSMIFFIYQEYSSNQGQAQTTNTLQEQSRKIEVQTRQIESLNKLIERALVQAANQSEVRFVVRERIADVRSKPEPGSSVEGKLLPKEVVRTVDERGKWVKVEYYNWIHEEYRTGWVLKKYLQRVPANFNKPHGTVGDP